MWKEALVFLGFLAISGVSHWIAHRYEQRKHRKEAQDAADKKVVKFSRVHAHVITAASAVASQPAFWASVKEYAVHFVIYSGNVLPPH